jgi:hypothetical protein
MESKKQTVCQVPVVHVYNPSHLGGWDPKNYRYMPSWEKKLGRPPFQWKKVGSGTHDCHPSNDGKWKIGGSQPRLAWAKSETLSPK